MGPSLPRPRARLGLGCRGLGGEGAKQNLTAPPRRTHGYRSSTCTRKRPGRARQQGLGALSLPAPPATRPRDPTAQPPTLRRGQRSRQESTPQRKDAGSSLGPPPQAGDRPRPRTRGCQSALSSLSCNLIGQPGATEAGGKPGTKTNATAASQETDRVGHAGAEAPPKETAIQFLRAVKTVPPWKRRRRQ